ncbi:MAG: glucose-6-phosphate isomerase [Anaerolineae bacterium]|nr:glucose-6-phosphate isomerase [Anaerolineae bacterium]
MTHLADYQAPVDAILARMREERVVPRVWEHDHTVWQPDPKEITNRLGWLHLPATMRQHIPDIEAFAAEVLAEGFTDVLLLGMGGSSLAPEVFSLTFAEAAGPRLALSVLDSTNPDAVLAAEEALDLRRTLFIVSTKSGGTVETLSFFKHFYNRMLALSGDEQAGRHFVAITDPGSRLETLGKQYGFRKIFLNDPNVGGRFSALSLVGLVPAALVGVDLTRLLDSGAALAEACRQAADAENPGAFLGAVMGVLAQAGRDKLTLVLSPEIASLGDWIEQLVAESTGKQGAGILPVVGEPPAGPALYGSDRVFVLLTLENDTRYDSALEVLAAAGHPVVRLTMPDRYAIGAQFMLWEFATAIASYILRINPFDQPNVEAAKVLAREAVKAYEETGSLPQVKAAPLDAENLYAFLGAARPGDYVALQAYVQPTQAMTDALQALRLLLRERYHLATTVGYGPRFLHSTGQLHKGDDGSGLFIQFVAEGGAEVPIPDEAGQPDAALTFGTLMLSQANGDYGALLGEGRRVIRFAGEGADLLAKIRALGSV